MEEYARQYRHSKNELRQEIRKSKTYCWKELLEDLEREPWGLAYGIVRGKLRQKNKQALPIEEKRAALRMLFPNHENFQRGTYIEDDTTEEQPVTEVTEEEILVAAERIRPGKALGQSELLRAQLKLS